MIPTFTKTTRKITCCKDCTERVVGCHATCEKYKAEKQANEEEREKRRKEKRRDR